MSDSQLQHLVDMANDIARNFSFHSDTSERVADHLTRFWAPSMRQMISQHVREGGQGLSDDAMQAVKLLKPC